MKFLDNTGLAKLVSLIKTLVNGKYTKPEGGIPKSDLASGVQTSLGKADTALQSADLSNYSLVNETGSKINLAMDSTTFKITATLYDKNDNLISTSDVIDLPLESVIVNVEYVDTEEHPKSLKITLQNGTITYVPVEAIVSGLATETYVTNAITAEDTSLKAWANATFLKSADLSNYYTKEEADETFVAKEDIKALTKQEVEDIWNA